MTARLPNIILIMCDDLGYGDTGFNGNEVIRTPYLDAMRAEGARFTRFFAGGPVCSPTRGTCLTGRHYSRYGITHANEGKLPTQEITLATVCKSHGYHTGHFGKWHVGTLTTSVRDGNRGGPPRDDTNKPGRSLGAGSEKPRWSYGESVYSPPWLHGFDVCFSTESMVPTWDPMLTPDELRPDGTFRYGPPGTHFGTRYWDQDGLSVEENLDGDDSRVIMDRVEPFVRKCAASHLPFLAVVWFHAPHNPIVAGPDYRGLYASLNAEEQHYYGCVTAMDEQVGRLNRLVKELGLEPNTMIWFCSDNGPEGGEDLSRNGRFRGTTGGLRGRKRSLFNGGIGVPALLKWPGRVSAGSDFQTPCSTLDYFPTTLEILGHSMPDRRPIDGVSLLPLIDGAADGRPAPIPFRFLESRSEMYGSPTLALIDDHYKFLSNLSEDGAEEMLFDLDADVTETTDLVKSHRVLARRMREQLADFIASCRRSHAGADYSESYTPINRFQEITGAWE